MFGKIELLGMSGAMARHASARQAVAAQNVANADTPGYKARDLSPFMESYGQSPGAIKRTRETHLTGSASPLDLRDRVEVSAQSPNGNAVSLEEEMIRSVDIQREHDLALTLYKTSLGILRSSLGRR